MFRKYILVSVFFLFVSTTFSQQNKSMVQLRAYYMKALHNCDLAPAVYGLFEDLKNPSPRMLAYKGALEAIMTKTTWNVFKKLSYLKKSEASFKEAVRKAPNNIEIRFMRMAVQYEIPEYLGYSEDMESDRKFIVNNIEQFDPTEFSHGTLEEILGFMNKCKRFTPDQIEKFKNALALK